MWLRISYIFCCYFLCLQFSSKAAEMLITGVYHGTNLYVQNPHDGKGNFCISEVYVNNVKAEHPAATAFDIDLSALKPQEVVNIKIIHTDNCMPKIMNLNAIKAREEFQFTNIEATDDKLIWVTKGEKKFGQYFIEVFKNNVWAIDKVFNCKAQQGNNVYDVIVTHASGTNRYRIKYLEISGKSSYSQEVAFVSDTERVTFYPKSVLEGITFSKVVKFEVLDAYYNVLIRGNGATIDCTKLKTGSYYLVFDNRTEKFLKK
jgi:hypothetical protein